MSWLTHHEVACHLQSIQKNLSIDRARGSQDPAYYGRPWLDDGATRSDCDESCIYYANKRTYI